MTTKSLETYLQDHRAGAAMGAELASRIADEYPQEPFGPVLSELSREVHQDKQALDDLVARLGLQDDPLKQAAGWVAEKVSRLKLTDAMTGDPELKRLLEFEVMAMGIDGKLALWHSLLEVADAYPELDASDLTDLAKRAEAQRASLEDLRRLSARAALAPVG